jgi:hypothetical protein
LGLLIVAVSTKLRPGDLPLPSDWLGAVLGGFLPETPAAELDSVAEIAGEPLYATELGFCALVGPEPHSIHGP